MQETEENGEKIVMQRRHGAGLLAGWICLVSVLCASSLPGGAVRKTKLIDLDPSLGNPTLAEDGLLDVTAAPFNADPTGKQDSTEALQKAINHARDNVMVTFFPPGTYRISDTLKCAQPARGGTSDPRLAALGLGKNSPRKVPDYEWRMVQERFAGETIRTAPFERPALYKRGAPGAQQEDE